MLDVPRYIYMLLTCTAVALSCAACSSDKPLENNFVCLFSAGEAGTECGKQIFYNSAKTKAQPRVLFRF